VNELATLIAGEIRHDGPIPFSRFMDLALYHPAYGYYRRPRDPFGRTGDFYTAEQLQPVFGRLMAAYLRKLSRELNQPRAVVVEMGAGRQEMAEAFAGFLYTPVEIGCGALPDRFSGIVFSNEFFDAIPVDLVVARDGGTFERRVALGEHGFVWDDTRPATALAESGVMVRELQHCRTKWLTRLAERLERGMIVTVDYGYTRRELVRFPEGTLMSYRRHLASTDVLAAPGEQDITAHTDFTALMEHGQTLGLLADDLKSLATVLLSAGEEDQFSAALEGSDDAQRLRHRQQLKSLLFGMGETFRVLVQRKGLRPVEGK
jgi:SAM-dependent MidA family methyltransferase